MNIQLLRELKFYIEKHINDDIIIKETETMDYIMPMRSAFRIDTVHKDEALSNDKKKDDGKWLEQFRRKSIPKVKEGQDTSYSRSLIHEEEELEDYINKEKSNETFSTKLLLYI